MRVDTGIVLSVLSLSVLAKVIPNDGSHGPLLVRRTVDPDPMDFSWRRNNGADEQGSSPMDSGAGAEAGASASSDDSSPNQPSGSGELNKVDQTSDPTEEPRWFFQKHLLPHRPKHILDSDERLIQKAIEKVTGAFEGEQANQVISEIKALLTHLLNSIRMFLESYEGRISVPFYLFTPVGSNSYSLFEEMSGWLNTHVLFIDIQKAFDTVPIGALLWKLQNMGFPRRTLAFLKALYTSLSARARAGPLLSGPFPVQRGVRQGCPLSGLLFNLFINDILDGVAPITVPGLPRDTNPIRGLMYADDVAVFADYEQSLLAASTAIEQWANRWEMQFGVAKCGIISFTGHIAPRLDNSLDIRLHGQLVSRVESYKYLGVLIDSKLDHSAWLSQKRSALEHTISALHPVLANHQLTVNYRSRIFSAVVMGKVYYELELVGGNKSHLAPLQTTINKGIRLFTGARLSTAIGPLLVETGIGSLLTRSLVSRVRLLERYVTKRTPINAICSGTDNDVFTLNVQGAVDTIPALVLVSSDQTAIQEQILADATSQTKDSQATALVYINGDSTNMWRLCIAPKQLLSTSIAHLVLECEQVTGHRIQSGLVPAIQKSRLRLLGRALDPGVENVYTWLRGGVLNGEADLDQR
ncbi:hypothetical protein BASA81_009436 [Batrachochytrium salamandrivorans]|nr:hypothetical protein BASA81_009436 [Batrachochytrium salamandrivorans]